jgi:hypothetical protein
LITNVLGHSLNILFFKKCIQKVKYYNFRCINFTYFHKNYIKHILFKVLKTNTLYHLLFFYYYIQNEGVPPALKKPNKIGHRNTTAICVVTCKVWALPPVTFYLYHHFCIPTRSPQQLSTLSLVFPCGTFQDTQHNTHRKIKYKKKLQHSISFR